MSVLITNNGGSLSDVDIIDLSFKSLDSPLRPCHTILVKLHMLVAGMDFVACRKSSVADQYLGETCTQPCVMGSVTLVCAVCGLF